MIEHPTVRAVKNPPVEPETEVEDISWLDAEERDLNSPRYWVHTSRPEREAELEKQREALLLTMDTDPDQIGGGLVDVRDYLPPRPRRVSRRLRAPVELVFAPTDDMYVPLEINLLVSRHPTRFAACFLFDVNEHGISVVAPVPLPTGSKQVICAHHREDPTPILATEVPVLSQRAYPRNMPRPGFMGDVDLWIHGLQTNARDARLLIKCTLDSFAYRQAGCDLPGLQHAS